MLQQVYTVLHLSLTKFDFLHAALQERKTLFEEKQNALLDLREEHAALQRVADGKTQARTSSFLFAFIT